MAKQFIQIAWLPPTQLTVEQFDADQFKVKTEDGMVKLIGPDGIMRIMPQAQVKLIQFITPEEKPRLIVPEMAGVERGPAQ